MLRQPVVDFFEKLLAALIEELPILIDGVGVNGTARAVRAAADRALKYAQTGFAQSYIFLMIVGTVAVVGYLLR